MYKDLIKMNPELYPENTGKAWSNDEILQLLQEIKEGKTRNEIANIHKRTPGGIYSRLRDIAADYYLNNNLPIEKIQKYTGLEKNNILDAIDKKQKIINCKNKKEETSTAASKASNTNDLKEILELLKETNQLLKDFIGGNYVKIKKAGHPSSPEKI